MERARWSADQTLVSETLFSQPHTSCPMKIFRSQSSFPRSVKCMAASVKRTHSLQKTVLPLYVERKSWSRKVPAPEWMPHRYRLQSVRRPNKCPLRFARVISGSVQLHHAISELQHRSRSMSRHSRGRDSDSKPFIRARSDSQVSQRVNKLHPRCYDNIQLGTLTGKEIARPGEVIASNSPRIAFMSPELSSSPCT